MAETVLPIAEVEYSANDYDLLYQMLAMGGNAATQGVIRDYANELVVAGTSTPVTVGTGRAFVTGKLYTNTAEIEVAVGSPSVDPRIDRVVLQLDFVAETCEAVLLAGSEDPSPTAPALTQNDGTLWEISLAQVHITTGGVITVTDERAFCGDGMTRISTLGADCVTGAKIADDAIDSEHYVDGSIDTAHLADDAVSNDKLRNSAALSVIGRATNSVGGPDDIAAGTDAYVLRRSGTALAFGQVATGGITDLAVTTGKLAADAVTGAKIADDAIAAEHLSDAIDAQPAGFNADKVDGYHAADIVAGGVIIGAIIMWYGSLGGTDGHRPIVSGTPNEDWHLCNGQTVGSVDTPDLQNFFPVGAGGSYNKGATGGSSTINIYHRHSAGGGGLTTQSGGSHYHAIQAPSYNNYTAGAVAAVQVPALNTQAATVPSLTVQGNTDYSLSATQDNKPPYVAVYFICKVA